MDTLQKWTVQDSSNIYGIKEWGFGYFDINSSGEVVIRCNANGQENGASESDGASENNGAAERNGNPSSNGASGSKTVELSILDIIKDLRQQGTHMPVMLRFQNILDDQITRLNESFRQAIAEFQYRGEYRGVFPIKVNQQQQVIEEIAHFGSRYKHGFEAGSKGELIVALSMISDTDHPIVCNGYKDADFFDLGLYAQKMGYQCFFVIETPSELPILIERSRALGIAPLVGIRLKLSSSAGGHWQDSGGDNSLFGLTTSEIIDIVDLLRKEDMLDCLQLLHYHLGSQIPNIRDIRNAVMESARFYVGLVKEGARMGFLDLGGGLAVDYDGSQTNFVHSKNYTLPEYCLDIVESLMPILDEHNVPHPCIMSESGRATVAYSSVLVCNVLDSSRIESRPVPDSLPADVDESTTRLWELSEYMNLKNMQECYNDAIHYRSELRDRFKLGHISLRERALGENIFLGLIEEIIRNLKKLRRVPKELEGLDEALYDTYYCNFSIFQSLPDAWAIEQIFPIIPLHRHNENPTRRGILGDITCDSDGQIDTFADLHDVKKTLPLHPLKAGEEYYLGFFLIGAYQETLGDLHNLLGDTNIVCLRVNADGSYDITQEIAGDSIADVLSYMEYNTSKLLNLFQNKTREALAQERISADEQNTILNVYNANMHGYTYFKR